MLKKLCIFLFVSFGIWGNSIQGIGSLFPHRISVLVFLVFMWHRIFVGHQSIAVFEGSALKTARLKNATVITFIVLMLCGFVTLYWAHSKSEVIVNLVTWFTSFFCIFMSLTLLDTQEDVIFAARAYIVTYLVICGMGIYESITGDYFNLSYDYYLRQKNMFGLYRPTAMMYNINNLAIFIVLSLPVCFMGTTDFKHKEVWDILLIALGETVILFTSCNTALVISCIIIAMYMFFHRKKGVIHVAAAIIVTVLIAFASVVAGIFSGITGYSASDELRFDLWKNAVAVSWKYFFMGTGPGNSMTANALYKIDSSLSVTANHNYLLTVFEEFGIIAAAFFTCWLGRFGYTVISLFRQTRHTVLRYAVIFCVIFLPSTLCASSMIGASYYWVAFGIIMACTGHIEREQSSDQLRKGSYYGK